MNPRCFVWATVCHCVSIFWYRRNHARYSREKVSLPVFLKWIFHASFLLPVVAMTICVLLATFQCHANRSRENETIFELQNNLSQVTDSYDGSTDRAILVSNILAAMRKANSLRIESLKSLNMVILSYLTSSLFLLSVFMPLLCVSWRDLKVKAEFLAQKLQQEGNESSDELAELMETTQDARATLLYRSLSVFFGLASCAPGMCWELYHSHKAFSREYAYYRVVSAFLSQGVVSVFLNIHLLVVNLHCNRLTAKRSDSKIGTSIPLHSTSQNLEIHEKPEINQSYY
ncbi:hypothetical protein PGT21_025318 [Puccinia graminis f. sp. tritici]|uniref:Uncharacterized protein n=1 Tax=Puccinia graminis f. sp. tritici TaxID=56615 RepID=A0A5B0M951_PUCGR|nr:hypothetical protein PGT21_025318 [Puccinia graminis f. sp. tritici]KAA1072693.1 hypothetical protein PGTUg99_018337 [Puccinia graminis f. sp. tritici]